ncbi:MAG: hypothetical protein KBT05_02080 [Bacteroidales bacterium]|nr:hypothetical protein [Candidatus Cryptobacteroides caccocaballi]
MMSAVRFSAVFARFTAENRCPAGNRALFAIICAEMLAIAGFSVVFVDFDAEMMSAVRFSVVFARFDAEMPDGRKRAGKRAGERGIIHVGFSIFVLVKRKDKCPI